MEEIKTIYWMDSYSSPVRIVGVKVMLIANLSSTESEWRVIEPDEQGCFEAGQRVYSDGKSISEDKSAVIKHHIERSRASINNNLRSIDISQQTIKTLQSLL